MPRTTAKPAAVRPTRSPAPNGPATNGPVAEVFTLAEAAAYLRLPEEELLRLVREQGLHAQQVGTDWRFLKSAIDDWLRSGPQKRLNEGLLGLAGAWKDDPTVDKMLDEIYRRRREQGEGDRR